MTSYNIHQRLFSLGLASNIAVGCKGTQAELIQKMDDALQSSIDNLGVGTWKVVWGPAVWKQDPESSETAAGHSWFVTCDTDLKHGEIATYVIAIAGVTANSQVDISNVQNIDQVVDFLELCRTTESPPVPVDPECTDPKRAYISLGAASGVYRLLNLASASQGTTLTTFLKSISSNSRIVFTGQSIGGMLASVLAPTALRTGMLKNISLYNIYVYSISSPSPGNRPFADLFAESFPLTVAGKYAYQVWNANIWSKFDLVPRAWNIGSVEEQNLWTIPSMYGKLPEPLTSLVSRAIKIMIEKSPALLKIDYTPIQGKMIIPRNAPPAPKTIVEFITTAGAQHVQAYVNLFAAPAPHPLRGLHDLEEAPIINLLNNAMVAIEKAGETSVSTH